MKLSLLQAIVWTSSSTFAAPIKEFVPTKEWQFVPEDLAIPGGLEIKMDLEHGGRWARYPSNFEKTHHEQPSTDSDSSISLVSLSESDLGKLEEKAYDHDYGTDIMRDYGASLIHLYNSKGPLSDHAGRIIGICLRNNQDAARAFTPMSYDLLTDLPVEKRAIMILSAVITTPEGLKLAHTHDNLQTLRENMSLKRPDESLARPIVSLVENLAIVGETNNELCQWASFADRSGLKVLKQLSSDIYAGKEDFAHVKCTKLLRQ